MSKRDQQIAFSSRKDIVDLLLQSVENVVEGPGTISKMRAKSVSEVVCSHDLSKGVHPALETTVGQATVIWYTVYSVSA